MTARSLSPRALVMLGTLLGIGVVGCSGFRAPAVSRTAFEQTYLPAGHNWEFRKRYRGADRLFNAFDYGHAVMYETLLSRPLPQAAQRLDGAELTYIVGKVLRDPPDVPLSEHAIGPRYTTLVPELTAMFEWAHMLHRQVYDVWADESLDGARKDAALQQLLRYYRTRPDLAFSTLPKSMDLMEGQSYSRIFRESSPKFNGLIWAYHWLQLALYDALMLSRDGVEARRQVDQTVERFWAMLAAPPSSTPTVMPMAAAIAPTFSARYPELAIVFDNLHSLHDVAADILASSKVPGNEKRKAMLDAAARYRDDVTAITSRAEWLEMSHAMGVERMGGVAVPEARTPR